MNLRDVDDPDDVWRDLPPQPASGWEFQRGQAAQSQPFDWFSAVVFVAALVALAMVAAIWFDRIGGQLPRL